MSLIRVAFPSVLFPVGTPTLCAHTVLTNALPCRMAVVLPNEDLCTLTNTYKATLVAMMAGASVVSPSACPDTDPTLATALVMVTAVDDFYRKTGRQVGLHFDGTTNRMCSVGRARLFVEAFGLCKRGNIPNAGRHLSFVAGAPFSFFAPSYFACRYLELSRYVGTCLWFLTPITLPRRKNFLFLVPFRVFPIRHGRTDARTHKVLNRRLPR